MKLQLKKYLDVILISCLLVCNLCFTSSKSIFIYLITELIAAIYLWQKKARIKLNLYFVWYTLFSLVLILYGVFTPYKGWFSLYYFLIVYISMIEIYILFFISKKDNYLKVIYCINCITYACALILLVREMPIFLSKFSLIIQGKDWFRLGTASHINPTAIAYFFGLLSNFTIYHFLKFKDKKYLVTILLQCLMIILSGSKKGIILLLIPFVVFAVIICIKKPKDIIKFLLAFIILFFVIIKVPFLYNMIGYRIITFLEAFGINIFSNNSVYASVDTSTLLRIDMIKEAFQLFKNNIFFGNGWNAFSALTTYRYYSHCNYLEILSSMGIFGFILYYSIYGNIIYQLKKFKFHTYGILSISLILALLISDFSSITMYDNLMNYFCIFILFIFTSEQVQNKKTIDIKECIKMIKKFFRKVKIHFANQKHFIRTLKKEGIIIGEKCEINKDVSFGSEPYLIKIGDNVRITSGVRFITHDGAVWVLRNKYNLPNIDIIKPIYVGNNVHIGLNSIIMPGVKIGNDVIIGCGAVVTKDIPDGEVWGGIPAKKIKTIEEYYNKNKSQFEETKNMTNLAKKKYFIKKFNL